MLQVNYRCVDIDDVMLNTIGGIFGFCVAYFGIPRLQTIFKKTKNNQYKGKEETLCPSMAII